VALRREDAFRVEAVPYAGKIKKGTYQRYWFHCRECDNEISSQHNYLKKHSGLCHACAHKVNPYAAGYGRLLHNIKTRGIAVEITLEQFQELCRIPNCHYCDTPINRSLVRGEKGYRGYFVDRKDNAVGYLVENCVPCCWSCNQAKGNRYSYEEFLMISRNLKEFRQEQVTPHWSQEFAWFEDMETDWEETHARHLQ
jgi:hypothetical protein